LNSIKRETKNTDYEVIVVDNVSKDKTREIIKQNHPGVKLIESNKNLGFGKGNNRGAREARGEVLFFLNPDTIVKNDCLEAIEEFFTKTSDAGAMAPRQLFKSGENRPENIADDPNLINLIRNIFPKKRNWGSRQQVDCACAAAIAILRDVFKQAGGFDPDFFMYMEENDLCLRIRKLGKKIYYDPKGKIIHLAGRSTKDVRDIKKMYYQSQDLFYQKHYSKPALYLMKALRWPKKIIKTNLK
jgi:hypothetical protein